MHDNKTSALVSLNMLLGAFTGATPFNRKHKMESMHNNASKSSELSYTVCCLKLLRHVSRGVSDRGTPGKACLKIPSPLLPRAALIAVCSKEEELKKDLLLEK